MAIVGVIVNPVAGKDIRRLVTNASPVSDASKIGQLRRVCVGALEAGATRLVMSHDHHQLARRATEDLDRVELLGIDLEGDRTDTVRAAAALRAAGATSVVVLGGDGTHRDVAAGWPDAAMVAMSTGTNNVFPRPWDATGAGLAAGLVASGVVTRNDVGHRAKFLELCVRTRHGRLDDVALVEVALVDGDFVGARAVWSPQGIRAVVAAIAEPTSTGLSSVAGMAFPVGRHEAAGAVVHLGQGGRTLRLPLAPGSFADVGIATTRPLALDETVALDGPGVLTLDGERTHVLRDGDDATVTLRPGGPWVIDVEAAVRRAAAEAYFDVAPGRDAALG